MKIKFVFLLCLFKVTLFSQNICGTDNLHENLLRTDSNYKKNYYQTKQVFNQLLQNQKVRTNALIPNDFSKPIVIKIVVHVIHNGEQYGIEGNISDQQIYNVIDDVNNIYRNYYNTSLNMNIQFQLADVDPRGNPTIGINRVDGSSIRNYVNGVVDPACGNVTGAAYTDISNNYFWDKQKYYNVYIVKTNPCTGWAGFAYYPTNQTNNFYDYMFINNRYVQSYIIAHEFGHALNLIHTFSDDKDGNSCPSNNNCSTEGDECCDTPPHKRGDCVTDKCFGNPDFNNSIYNYMSYCHVYGIKQNRFTPNQSERTSASLNLFSRLGLKSLNKRFIIENSVVNNLGGTIRESIEVDSNSSTPIFFTPNIGFELDSLWINKVNVPNLKDSQYVQLKNIQSNKQVAVKFKYKNYNINYQILNGSFSKFYNIVNIGSIIRFEYNANPGYIFNYISINDKKYYDSSYGYTLKSIGYDLNIKVHFIESQKTKIVSFNKYIIKLNDTLEVRGRNISKILFQEGIKNIFFKSSILANKIQINEFDTLYKIIIPLSCKNTVYRLFSLGFNSDTSNFYLIRTYKYDNLTNLVWGANTYNQFNSSGEFKNIVKADAGGFYTLYLDKFGKVFYSGGGITPDTVLKPPSNLENVVDIFSGLGYQCVALLNDGTIITWGGTEGKISNNIQNVLEVAGLFDASFVLNQNGLVTGVGSVSNLNKYNVDISYQAIKAVSIKAGLNHFTLLDENGFVYTYGDLPNIDSYTKNIPNNFSNNKFIAVFAKRYNSSAAIREDSTAVIWGLDNTNLLNNQLLQNKFIQIGLGYKFIIGLLPNGNLIGIGDQSVSIPTLPIPDYVTNVKDITVGNDFAVALVDKPFVLINTSVLNGKISNTKLLTILDSNYRITYLPNDGYFLDSIFINNVYVGKDSLDGYTFKNIVKSQLIRAVFSIKKFKIFIYKTVNNITTKDSIIANYGDNKTINIIANPSYIIDSIFINNRFNPTYRFINNLDYIFQNIKGDSIIKIVYKSDPCNYTKTTPIINRLSQTTLISNIPYYKYNWYLNSTLNLSSLKNEFIPATIGVYSLQGQDTNLCEHNFSKKYYFSTSCIIPNGRLSNAIAIQSNIFNEYQNLIKFTWCPELINNIIYIQVINLNGNIIFSQSFNASTGGLILNKNLFNSKQYFIRVLDENGEILQISDMIF